LRGLVAWVQLQRALQAAPALVVGLDRAGEPQPVLVVGWVQADGLRQKLASARLIAGSERVGSLIQQGRSVVGGG
jgi:hypothetical protein